jgi:hypothetical protein
VTETARALLAKGLKSRYWPVSDDIEKSFLESGANAFIMKPSPCRHEALSRVLLRRITEKLRSYESALT